MAHRLIKYEGPCANLHGHTYTAIIEYGANEVDHQGFVLDFSEITKYIKSKVDLLWDHGTMLHENDPLSKIIEGYTKKIYLLRSNPTAENIAKELYKLSEIAINTKKKNCYLLSVRVKETPTSEAYYCE